MRKIRTVRGAGCICRAVQLRSVDNAGHLPATVEYSAHGAGADGATVHGGADCRTKHRQTAALGHDRRAGREPDKGEPSAIQCQMRNGAQAAVISTSIQGAPLPHSRRRLLRMEKDENRAAEHRSGSINKDGAPIAFAGIWSSESTSGGNIDSCAIITCAANALVSPVHARMPVILPPQSYEEWLNPEAEIADLLALVQPAEWREMSYYSVSNEVNRAANDYPALVERVGQTGLW